MRRTSDFNAEMSERLSRSKKFRQSYILDYIENDGLSVEDALRQTIGDMGVNEFSDLSSLPKQLISSFRSGNRKLKPESLDAFLEPFGLKTKIIVEKLRAA